MQSAPSFWPAAQLTRSTPVVTSLGLTQLTSWKTSTHGSSAPAGAAATAGTAATAATAADRMYFFMTAPPRGSCIAHARDHWEKRSGWRFLTSNGAPAGLGRAAVAVDL